MKTKPKPRKQQEEFPELVVLAVGYPWFYGAGPYTEMAMQILPILSKSKPLAVPKALLSPKVPTYRLILQRVRKP